MDSEVIRLDIGCGRQPKEGFIGVDRFVIEAPIHADMWDLPYPDDSVDEIWSSHALEHIAKARVVPTLKEWRRVLLPGAHATIQVPDLEWCCKRWLEHLTNDWWLDIIFGNQETEGEFHKTGFTTAILADYLNKAGFFEADFEYVWSHDQSSIQVVATK